MERESNPMQAMCRSGCGFYGNPATEGLCSKCFKETLKKKQQPPNPPPTSSPSATVAAAAAAALSFQQGAGGGVGGNVAAGAFLGGSPGAAAHGGTPFPLLVQAAAASPRSTRLPLANVAADFLKDIGADEGDLGRINREMRKVHDGWVDLKEGGAEATAVDGAAVAGASGEGKPAAAPTAAAATAAAAAAGLGGNKTPPDTPDKNAIAKKKKTRCISCRKKLGLTGFECRCGGLYCAVHRYSDKHSCTFDYREMGAQEIRRNNPVVVGEKIQKI